MRRWRKPPIWETEEWEKMTWEEKMDLWKRHRRQNFVLGSIFITVFMGSLSWFLFRNPLSQSRARFLIPIIMIVMGTCLYLGQNLMD